MFDLEIRVRANQMNEKQMNWMFQENSFQGTSEEGDFLNIYFNSIAYSKTQEIIQVFQTTISIDITWQIFEAGYNWNKTWEENAQPIIINDRVCISQKQKNNENPAYLNIYLNFENAFGTGHHPTTRMMIEHMLKLEMQYLSVCDFGAGTGILSILAENMGATHIIAVENNSAAIKSLKENIVLNSCSKIHVIEDLNGLKNSTPFGIVCINVTWNIIIENIHKLLKLCQSNCLIVLSGILDMQYQSCLSLFKELNCNIIHTSKLDSWNCITFQKCAE